MSLPSAPPLPTLSIVIPAFQEEARLGDSLERILAYLDGRGIDAEVVVVDDGSRDGTAAVASSRGDERVRVLRQPVNRGKGAALRRGVGASRGRRVLVTDADLSTPIDELARLEAALAEGEVAIGSRGMASSNVVRRQPLYRELMGRTFNLLIRLGGVRGIRDTQCGFKLFEGEVARRLFALLTTPGFAYDVEIVWLARRLGYRVVEVGVCWVDSPSSRVHVLRDPPRMLLELLRFRWRHRDLRPPGEEFAPRT